MNPTPARSISIATAASCRLGDVQLRCARPAASGRGRDDVGAAGGSR